MANFLTLSLTDELRSFIEENCGDGALYATPSEFVCAPVRQSNLRAEATRVRDAIVAGYQDAIEGRILPFEGNLRSLLKKAKAKQ
jgi:antitoxin ParD1/3/4